MIQLIKQYMKVVLHSLISVFLDLPHTFILFYPCLFKDITTLCKSFVICLVCGVTSQKLRLYEYSGKPALF